MKKTDIAMIILVAGVSVLISYFVVNSIPFFKDASDPVEVQVADPISAEIVEPDPAIFNKDAVNPTIEVYIGNEKPQKEATDSSNDDK